ncbi:hypothetical protein JOC77_003569 [Peribacillus deserti]|uniref:Uncharacterized protein n=1 Tax=Peribacillus deserti TaxID=673318 RepID=A0ABS2QM86_9BACI|nr:hypothetical protein [Peribacillus deserti]MBM7694125.1 hypothetical protein [Peribacillus deserti]
MNHSEKDKILAERNDKEKAFRDSQEKQLERDQILMPVDDLPLEDIREEYQEERDGEKSKDESSSEKKLLHGMNIKNDLPE